MGLKVHDLETGELKDGVVAEPSKDRKYEIPPCSPEEWETIEPTENDIKNVKNAFPDMCDEDEILFQAKTKRYRKNFAQRHRDVFEQHEKDGTLDKLPKDNMFNPHAKPAVGTSASNPASMQIVMRPRNAFHMMKVELPENVIGDINGFVDDTLIPNDKDLSNSLVGQINRTDKSKQLEFDHKDESVGQMLGGLIENLGNAYLQNALDGNSHWTKLKDDEEYKTRISSMWTVHSYAGDYNPLHDHGTETEIGLSCILYLKVPEQIEALPNPAEDYFCKGLNGASGCFDGFTYFCWGAHGMRDANMLRPVTEEYVKPEVGTMLIFPSWLRHSVNPFFGEGERRTLSANLNVDKKKKVIK